MGLKQEPDLKVSEEAAVWLCRLREEDAPDVRAAFDAWVRKGAGNLQEFLLAQALWKEMDHIDSAMRRRLWPADEASPVVDFPNTKRTAARHSSPVRWQRWAFAAAAALALCAIALRFMPVFGPGIDVYTTDIGNQKSVKLADGSVLHLNTRSRAEVHYGEHERVIRLIYGEALFAVARDSSRPFSVLTDNARILALGTEFNVYRNSRSATSVAVVDGVVQVDVVGLEGSPDSSFDGSAAGDARLKAGDEAQIEAGKIVRASKPNIERATSWRERKLVFPGNPVSEIVEQFNRYNRTRIRIEGEDVRRRRISGLFDADDPSPLLQYLGRDPEIEVVHEGDGILIRPRRN